MLSAMPSDRTQKEDSEIKGQFDPLTCIYVVSVKRTFVSQDVLNSHSCSYFLDL